MLSRTTIEAVNDIPLLDVVKKYVPDLKQAGANWLAKSPWTDEKSASFTVSPAKNVFKCFSSGNGGNSGVTFLMKKSNLTYPEAVKELAREWSIEIVYDDDRGKEHVEKYQKLEEITEINRQALEFWTEQLEKAPENQLNRIDKDQREEFAIGYAPDSWTALKDYMIGKGHNMMTLYSAGLIKPREDGNSYYDVFRSRIIFPVLDHRGKIVGFSGRSTLPTPEEQKNSGGKVFNTKDTAAYTKSKSLLGLHLAIPHITKVGFAIKVEGNVDCTSFHHAGMKNTVATLGTAITEEQLALIKRYTNHLVMAVDNDKAGRSKIEKDTKLAMQVGFSEIEVWYSDNKLKKAELAELTDEQKARGYNNQDPDDWVKSKPKWKSEDFITDFNNKKQDAIEYLAHDFFIDAKSISEKHAAQKKLESLLICIPEASRRNMYVKRFASEYKISKTDIEESIKIELTAKREKALKDDNERGIKIPPFVGEEGLRDFDEYGFYADERLGTLGYYFPTTDRAFEKICNFTMKPIFQVVAQKDSKRVVEIKKTVNGTIVKELVEMPNSAFVSHGDFDSTITNLGHAYFNGERKHFKKLRVKWLNQFPQVREILTLGWQRAGFWAFADGIVANGRFEKIDSYGLAVHNEQKYFLPALSEIYSMVQEENDQYLNAKKYVYKESGADFETWANLYCQVYKDEDNGWFSVAFLIAAVFSDYIYAMNNDFPILFNFGLIRTGKTTAARSLSKVFKSDATPLNLSNTTKPGLTNRLAQVRNAIEHLDEYTEELAEDLFQVIKGVFDRTGREKAAYSRDTRTETTKINAAVNISGQYIPLRDGGSVYTRSILITYRKTADKFTTEEHSSLLKLQKLENAGLSNIIAEIIKFRDYLEENFDNTQFSVLSDMKNELRLENYDGRVLKNFVVVTTMVKLFEDKLKLPFTYTEFYKKAIEKIKEQSAAVAEGDQLAEFFNIMVLLARERRIGHKHDYIIEDRTELTIRIKRTETKPIVFDEPKKVLFITLQKIHGLYLSTKRSQSGNNGLALGVLTSYLKDHRAFIGSVAKKNFTNVSTSAYCLDYDALDIDLPTADEFISGNETGAKPVEMDAVGTVAGKVIPQWKKTDDDDLPF